MSEYWVSTPKYWCKHCSTFVVDTPLSRKNHDATGKHQSALRKFLRDLHRENEKATAATETAKREVARLNALVSGQPDPSAASSSTTPSHSVAKPEIARGTKWGVSERPLTEAEKKRQIAELAALGVAMPDQVRPELAMPGEWQTVSVTLGKTDKEEREERERQERIKAKQEEEKKRKWEDMDEDEKELRSFKVQERRWPGADEEEGGELDIGMPRWRVKTKVKPEPAGEDRKVGFKIEGKVKKEDMTETEILAEIEREAQGTLAEEEVKKEGITIKKEEEETPALPPAVEDEPVAPVENAGGVIFKKRKVKNIRKKD